VDRMVKRRVRSTAFHVSSKVPTGRRVELLREFRESPSAVITNARCLTEGVDVPNVDAVLFADPRRSTIDIVQAVGRTLRKNPKNPDKIGYVLLPVLVEDGQTVEEFLESSAFKEVGRVLAVLSTHDERIAEEFRAKDAGGKRPAREQRIIFSGDVPVGVRLSAEDFAARCGARVWQRVARVNWRPFEEARDWVRGLGLRGQGGWKDYRAGRLTGKPPKPSDVPTNPNLVYRDEGWTSWGDWFGTGTVHGSQRTFRPFAEARAWTRGLGLRNQSDWRDFCAGHIEGKPSKPADLPSAPDLVYKDKGWVSWGDWIGSGRIATHIRTYRPYTEARAWVRGLGLRSGSEWLEYSRGRMDEKPPKPLDIPTNPNSVYREKGWTSWGEWLGTGAIAPQARIYRPFGKARLWVRGLGLRGRKDWWDFCAGRLEGMPPKPADIPSNPQVVFKDDGWSSWGDWFGTGTVASFMRIYRPYAEAREWTRGLGLRSYSEWVNFCAGRLEGMPPKPADIPSDPVAVYKDKGWIGSRDWLGTNWWSFTEARAWARGLGLRSSHEWKDFCVGRLEGKPPKPFGIPSTPQAFFKDDGWTSWGDFLGTDRKPRQPKKRRS
jgi:hypothetical protein